jgi:hypothetical protein
MPHSTSLQQAVHGTATALRSKLAMPSAIQRQVLQDILKTNAATAYGSVYQFATINDAADFQTRLPIVTYDALVPWIDRIVNGEQNILTVQPVIAFEETGGSTAGRKLIPYTADGLAAFRRGLLPWLDDLFSHHDGLASGAFYWSISPACRAPRAAPTNIPIGLPSDAAYLGAEIGHAITAQLAVPAEAGQIADFDGWRDYTMRHLLACEDLSMISVWSPTFLTELLHHAKRHGDRLAAAIAEAGNAVRARQVAHVLAQAQPDYEALWPQLRMISCWDHASANLTAQLLRKLFPGTIVQGKGLLATEGLVTLPLTGYPFPVLALESGFFEFIDECGTALLAEQVQDGATYGLVMTTHSGLYRYAIGDMVTVRGFADRTPMLEFVGRSNTASDLCGEKLTDAFVMSKLALLEQSFAMLAPFNDDSRQGYVLLLDNRNASVEMAHRLAVRLDTLLEDNPQYAYARRLGQLSAVVPVLCEYPAASWLEYRSRTRGVRLGDVKMPALHPGTDWRMWARIAPRIVPSHM